MNILSSESRDELPDSQFAFPAERRTPIGDAAHVRSAVARFNQVTGISDAERSEAREHIRRGWRRQRA